MYFVRACTQHLHIYIYMYIYPELCALLAFIARVNGRSVCILCSIVRPLEKRRQITGAPVQTNRAVTLLETGQSKLLGENIASAFKSEQRQPITEIPFEIAQGNNSDGRKWPEDESFQPMAAQKKTKVMLRARTMRCNRGTEGHT